MAEDTDKILCKSDLHRKPGNHDCLYTTLAWVVANMVMRIVSIQMLLNTAGSKLGKS